MSRTVLLRLQHAEGGFVVDDIGLGTRYGAGATAREALNEYVDQVRELMTMDEPLGAPLSQERDRYSKFLDPKDALVWSMNEFCEGEVDRHQMSAFLGKVRLGEHHIDKERND